MKKNILHIIFIVLLLSSLMVFNVTASDVSIVIYRYEFSNNKLIINPEDSVTWTVMDKDRFHMIACYDRTKGKEKRVFISPRLYDSNSYSATFSKTGKYLCIDPIFGIRSDVTVQEAGLPFVTGAFVMENRDMQGFSSAAVLLTVLAVIVAAITLMVQHRLKKKVQPIKKVKKDTKVKKRR